MQVIIQSPRLRIKGELTELIQKKMQHLEKINKHITKCEIVLKKENDDHKKDCCIEIQLTMPGKKLFAHATGTIFPVALQNVVDNLDSQLRRIKTGKEWIS